MAIPVFCNAKGELVSAPLTCLPLAIFYPGTQIFSLDGFVEITAKELFDCLVHPTNILPQGAGAEAEPELPPLIFNYADPNPPIREAAESSSPILDDGAILDSADVSYINSETSDVRSEHVMSDSMSEGSDDLEVDMNVGLSSGR
jgi:hypothetical protein